MITKLNLATQPFRNRTLPYLLAVVLLAVALGGTLWAFAKLNDVKKLNDVAKTDVERMKTELAELNKQGELVQKELTPEQRAVLIGSHKLVANKSFAWSRLFADLEGVLPGSVSASRIAVENIFQDAGRIRAELEFAVLSKDYASVEEMINRMNGSGVFKAELRSQDRQQTERLTYTEFTLRLVYTPDGGYGVPGGSNIVRNEGGAE